MAKFPFYERSLYPPLDSSSDNIPQDIDLVTALDKVILDISIQYNNKELRVADYNLGKNRMIIHGMDMAPIYFTPGINANPLVPSSNPLNIARDISNGLYDRQTRDRIEKFAKALFKKHGDSSIRDQIMAMDPSHQPVFVYANTARVETWYRGLDGRERFADEFLTYPEESVREYNLIEEECIRIIDSKIEHSKKFRIV